ncbi:hypothetical protein [Candidatus Poriferisocius sp.]|uniref:hypothetical protein n=1 Tax=Candidatus Poriferisocius sp. TaxID=3101276 RepID=UPI003B595841
MTPPPPDPGDVAETGQHRPEWLPAGTTVIEHVRQAAKKLGPPPELDLPGTDWDWDADDLLAEAWRTGCIPEAQLRRALGAKGEDKPWWWVELSTASGDPIYIRDRPEITIAAASDQLGERAKQIYHELVELQIIANSAPHQPNKQPKTPAAAATAPGPGPGAPPTATWQRIGQKTVEICLTTASKRRYRADPETLDTLLTAAASTGRLGDPRRLEAAQINDDVELTTLPGGKRQAARNDGTATAVAEPVGAKTVEIALTATTTRRYRATDTEAPRLCAAAETLQALHDRTRMLPEHTPQTPELDTTEDTTARGIDIGL